MGLTFDKMYGTIMESAKTTGIWESWTPAQREKYASDMSLKVQNYLNAKEQAALTEGLCGNQSTTSAPVQTQTPVTAPITEPVTTNSQPASQQQKAVDKIKVAKKMKVGTAKTGFKFYLIDKQGNTYQVDRKTYNAAKKGKMASIAGATTVDTTSPKVARKVKKASGKIKKAKIKLITDPEAYHNQRQNMYNNLMGKGEQVPMHKYNIVNDTVAYNNQRQAMYNNLLGKGEQVPMHNYRIVNDPSAYRAQQQDMYSKLFNSSESHIIEAKGDIRRLETKLADANKQILQSVENNGQRIGLLNNKVTTLTDTVARQGRNITALTDTVAAQSRNISSLERTIAQNTQAMGRMERAIASQGDDIAKLTNKLSKTNKRLALAVGVATFVAGGIGYLIGKSNEKNEVQQNQTPIAEQNQSESEGLFSQEIEEKNQHPIAEQNSSESEGLFPQEIEEKNQAQVTEQTDSATVANQTPVTTVVEASDTIQQVQQPVQAPENQQNPEEIANLPLNTVGEYTTVKGDSFWKIAERYLKDKFKNEPDKFENLTAQQKDALIQKECERIMKQNNYWYDENHNLPKPMLYQSLKIAVSENIDKAA